MSYNSIEIGKFGEKKAKMFLISRGYEILDTNFTTKIGEIDIICRNEEFIVFVEVKIENKNFPSLLRVDKRKLEKIKKNALVYLKLHPQYDKLDIRFDLISVRKTNGLCDHYTGVYFD